MAVFLSPVGGAAGQFFDNNGTPLSGGKLFTYAAGTTTPQTAYTTSAGTVAHTNPIILDAAGRVPTGEIWLSDGLQYKFVIKTSTDILIATYDDIVGINDSANSAAQIAYVPPFPNATATTVSAKLAQTVSVTDFGATGNGNTDDTIAIQNAFNYITASGGGTVLFPEPSVSYRTTAPITVASYTSVVGQSRDTKIFRDFTNGFAFVSIGQTYITYDNLWIYSTTPSTVSPSGGIGLQDSSYCRVSDVTIVGMRQYGVWLYNTSYSTVENCSFSGWIGSYQQDSCDVAVLNNSNYNTVQNNKCFGGGDHGVLVQDTYAGAQPTGNKVLGNTIGEHTAYGIALYVTNTYDTKTIISGNEVKDITGTSLLGASGAGIYIQSGGGAICTNNTVSNCCRNTTNFFTLAPAAIGVTLPVNAPPVIVRGNNLRSVRGPCIAAITLDAPILIDGNVCSVVTSDSAVNPRCIYVSNAQRSTISNNILTQSAPAPAIDVIARAGTVVKDTSITNNSIKTTTTGIFVTRIDTSTHANVRIIGNYVEGSTAEGLKLERTSNASIIGNIVESSATVFELNNCTNVRMEGNSLSSSNTTNSVIFFVGTNTGTIVSETNTLVGRVSNDGTGVLISRYGTTAPVSGNFWGVGDRVIQSVPVVGQPKGWRCTVAGNPGTWVSEGNL